MNSSIVMPGTRNKQFSVWDVDVETSSTKNEDLDDDNGRRLDSFFLAVLFNAIMN